MKLLIVYCLIILMAGCSKNDNTILPDLPPADNSEVAKDYNHYFDSLAAGGAKYGFQTVVPRGDFDIVLSSPGQTSMTMTILFYVDCTAYISYSMTQTPEVSFKAGVPQKIVLQNLSPNTDISYLLHYKKVGSASYVTSKQFRFSMPGNESENFRFAVIADSHIDENSDTAVYQMTLKNIGEYGYDFLVDMGDTFMTDKYGQEYTLAQGQYLAQRYYLGSVCHSLPLYLIQGNHDGETGDKRAEMTAWATRMSEMYFPGPDPKNYYYWERGDALMVVLDPFTYTSSQGSRDPWQRTLGEIQYHWLENVLKNSAKKFKFVFIHNLVGGVDVEGQSRGGAEAALYYEWGGKNWEGADEFSTKRNNWNMPIHQLLKKYGVQVVFHGHDHLYAKQEYDGIIYQCVQQPGLKRYDKLIYGDTYGYKNGILKYNPGHIRVKISPMNATIEYVSHLNTILDTYTL